MVDHVEEDLRAHAKTLSHLVAEISTIRSHMLTTDAVVELTEKHLNERLGRMEASLKAVYSLGQWLLGAVGAVLITAVVGFVLRGGPLG